MALRFILLVVRPEATRTLAAVDLRWTVSWTKSARISAIISEVFWTTTCQGRGISSQLRAAKAAKTVIANWEGIGFDGQAVQMFRM
jgi:hypothetical protein